MDVISVIVVALCLITDGYILFSDKDFLKWTEAIAVLFPEHYFYCI